VSGATARLRSVGTTYSVELARRGVGCSIRDTYSEYSVFYVQTTVSSHIVESGVLRVARGCGRSRVCGFLLHTYIALLDLTTPYFLSMFQACFCHTGYVLAPPLLLGFLQNANQAKDIVNSNIQQGTHTGAR
jgi:hypothetical protein